MSTVKKVINNSIWIILCRVIKAFLAAVVSIFTARLLGAEDFGLLNYTISLISFVSPFVLLGFNSILVQELLTSTEEGETLGTAIIASLCSAVLGMGVSIGTSYLIAPNDTVALSLTAIYSVVLLFHATELIQYWFQAKYRSKTVAIVGLVVYFAVSCCKIILLFLQVGVYWFALSYILEFLFVSAVLIYVYIKEKNQRLKFSFPVLKHLLRLGVYYAISAFMVNVFTHIDKLMIKTMLGNEMNGIYSVAVACSGMFTFIFAAIIEAMRPYVLEGKNKGDAVFESRLGALYSILIYLGIFCGVIVCCAANLLIHILYGIAYSESVTILQILIWNTILSCIGGAKDIWILSERKQKYLLLLNTSGVVLNVLLNMLLIPVLGIVGAAIATVVTQFTSNIFLCVLIKDLRKNAAVLYRSLNPFTLIQKYLQCKKGIFK